MEKKENESWKRVMGTNFATKAGKAKGKDSLESADGDSVGDENGKLDRQNARRERRG